MMQALIITAKRNGLRQAVEVLERKDKIHNQVLLLEMVVSVLLPISPGRLYKSEVAEVADYGEVEPRAPVLTEEEMGSLPVQELVQPAPLIPVVAVEDVIIYMEQRPEMVVPVLSSSATQSVLPRHPLQPLPRLEPLSGI